MRPAFVSTRIAALTIALALSGCAVGGGAYPPASARPPGSIAQPAARMGLAPSLRIFYDELEPYGQWVLIEPQGWVFHPDVNTVAWRPYQDGWWEPSDLFGWIWNTDEPFGWLTYHYGLWFYDRYQGWVWAPTTYWGPSWVAWVQAGDYLGWAPLPPEGAADFSRVPGGVFTYVPATMMAQPNPTAHATYVTGIRASSSDIRPIIRLGTLGGVAFNMGPDPHELLRTSQPFETDASVVRRLDRLPTPGLPADALRQRIAVMVAEARREAGAFHDQGQAPPAAPPPSTPLSRPPGRNPLVRPGSADSTSRPFRPSILAPRDSSRFAPNDSGPRLRIPKRGAKPARPGGTDKAGSGGAASG